MRAWATTLLKSIEEGWEAEAAAEQYAEVAYVRAMEYDARMDDPREW
jgi:hypothetical protein